MIAYAITDPQKLFSENSQEYISNLKSANWVLYRDKQNSDYNSSASKFIELFKDNDTKLLLHQDYNLASNLGVWGVHLTSSQIEEVAKAKDLGLFVVVSTHSFKEISKAQELGANAVTFSPIFATPNKGKPKGAEALNEALKKFSVNIIALGGIVDKEQIDLIANSGAFGFASIRYFY